MSQKLRSHVLCNPCPAHVSFSRVFRLMSVFRGYNAAQRDESALSETKKRKRKRRTNNQDCPSPLAGAVPQAEWSCLCAHVWGPDRPPCVGGQSQQGCLRNRCVSCWTVCSRRWTL